MKVEIFESAGMIFQIKPANGRFYVINQMGKYSRLYSSKDTLIKMIENKKIDWHEKRIGRTPRGYLSVALRRDQLDSLAKLIKYDQAVPKTQPEIKRLLRYIEKSCVYFKKIRAEQV